MFLALNDEWISAPEDDRFVFVIAVANGSLRELGEIAEQLRMSSHGEL